MKPEFDTQAAVRPWERIDLSRWEHVASSECDIRPHYSGSGGKWVCDRCGLPVRGKV